CVSPLVSSPGSSSPAPPPPQTLRYGMMEDPDALDPTSPGPSRADGVRGALRQARGCVSPLVSSPGSSSPAPPPPQTLRYGMMEDPDA
ncbi:hypothetical protein CTI14_65310, partial [Methylobacterium radiotolerans]